jgi:hypothetical protein
MDVQVLISPVRGLSESRLTTQTTRGPPKKYFILGNAISMTILFDSDSIKSSIIICWILCMFITALAHSTRWHDHSSFPTRVTPRRLSKEREGISTIRNSTWEPRMTVPFVYSIVLCRMCLRSIPRSSLKHSYQETGLSQLSSLTHCSLLIYSDAPRLWAMPWWFFSSQPLERLSTCRIWSSMLRSNTFRY